MLERALAILLVAAPPAPEPAPAPSAPAGITLDEALAVAARESPDLATARADADASAADRLASTAAILPRLDLSASVGHDFAGKTAPRLLVQGGLSLELPGMPASDQEAYGLSLQLTQTVFDWKAMNDVRGARLAASAAERRYDEAALAVAFDVTRRFYEAVRSDRALAVLEKTAARSQDLVSRADALFAAGRAPKSDTLQARVNLANDRVAVEAQRILVAQARTALAQALGREGGEIAAVPPAHLEGAPSRGAEPPPLDELLAAARARRPTLAAEAALVRAADSAVSSARAGWFPSLSAQAYYSRQGESLGDGAGAYGVFGDPTRAYTAAAQLVVSVNLFEGRLTLANVRRAEASARRARASRVRTVAQVAKEVADARSAVVALARKVALTAEGLTLAEQGLALARQRLETGLGSQLEIRDASLKLGQAELSLVEARIDDAIARADLARAVGGAL